MLLVLAVKVSFRIALEETIKKRCHVCLNRCLLAEK